MSDTPPSLPSARALLREHDYLRLWSSRWMGSFGSQIQSVTMGWQVYEISRRAHLSIGQSALNVSLIGLITFAPLFFLALPAGESADRHDRRGVLLFCYAGESLAVAVLVTASLMHFATVPLLLGVALVFGSSRAFFSPAMTALAPMLVPREHLPRAIAWNSLAWQSASIAGPAMAGVLIAFSPGVAYAATLALYIGAATALLLIRGNTRPAVQPGSRLELVKEVYLDGAVAALQQRQKGQEKQQQQQQEDKQQQQGKQGKQAQAKAQQQKGPAQRPSAADYSKLLSWHAEGIVHPRQQVRVFLVFFVCVLCAVARPRTTPSACSKHHENTQPTHTHTQNNTSPKKRSPRRRRPTASRRCSG